MAASDSDLRKWYEEGKAEGATHMIVVCDTFDWEDYPVFVKPEEDVQERVAHYKGKDMQKVMEVYKLALPFEQSNVRNHFRAWNL